MKTKEQIRKHISDLKLIPVYLTAEIDETVKKLQSFAGYCRDNDCMPEADYIYNVPFKDAKGRYIKTWTTYNTYVDETFKNLAQWVATE